MINPETEMARGALAELHVELRLDDALRAMALADIKAPLMEVALSASAAERLVIASREPRLREVIADIRESISRALSQISGLADEHSLAVDLRVTDPAEVLSPSVRAVHPLARARGVRVESLASMGGPRALCDRIRTVRALVTVLCVALRRSREGDTVRVGFERGDGALRLTVTDSGPAMDADAIEAMLSPVLQSEEGLPTRDLGRARRAIELQGGRLGVRSEAQGVTFELELPAPPARPENFSTVKPF